MGQKPDTRSKNTSALGSTKPKHTRPDKNKWIQKFLEGLMLFTPVRGSRNNLNPVYPVPLMLRIINLIK
jgi:hypothetical protein